MPPCAHYTGGTGEESTEQIDALIPFFAIKFVRMKTCIFSCLILAGFLYTFHSLFRKEQSDCCKGHKKGLGERRPGFEFQFCYWLSGWLGSSRLCWAPLCLSLHPQATSSQNVYKLACSSLFPQNSRTWTIPSITSSFFPQSSQQVLFEHGCR